MEEAEDDEEVATDKDESDSVSFAVGASLSAYDGSASGIGNGEGRLTTGAMLSQWNGCSGVSGGVKNRE